ncbi:aminopeptidase N-like [Periplaneta americana]|uniref:aminopeptidase N-like n=1 Tax=Periplaneta americana TaxID=6978 RepID=UPI0037E8045B
MGPLQLGVAVLLLLQVSSEEINFRLSRAVVPTHYRLDIEPHFEDDNFTFYGQVWIDVEVKEDSYYVTLHSSELAILEASVVPLDDNETLDVLPFPGHSLRNLQNRDSKFVLQQDRVTLFHSFKAGGRYLLHLRYQGQLSSSLTGFYKLSYVDSHNNTRWMASTTFEPNEARKAYPCFDEPGFKAHFQVNLASRDDVMALSNMPRASVHNMTEVERWQWNRFEETPPISTYLVAFFVGHLEFRETKTKGGTPFRAWARPDMVTHTKYALDIAPRILDYFSSLLGVSEPLPKHDLLALPRFVADALENWGLISFGEKYLLHDAGLSPESSRQHIAQIMSHELSHSWFGNMVTPHWWKDIWLNEGFATYFSAVGANYVNPSWDSISMTTVTAFLNVFSVDSLMSSHPLTFPLDNQNELRQIFDVITYYKGYYVLRMLNHTLGESSFLKGCGRYLEQNKFGAVNQSDLWVALDSEAHERGSLPHGLNVRQVMDAWTSLPGFPILTVTRNYTSGTATVTQTRFQRPREDVEARHNTGEGWWVPLTYTSQLSPDFNSTRPKLWLDPGREETQLEDMPGRDHWVIFNVQAAGLYRVNYDMANWHLLSQQLDSDKYEEVSVLNRALLIDDALDLARADLLPYPVALNVTSYLRRETHYLAWKSALSNLGYIRRMLRLTDALPTYKRFIQHLVEQQFLELGVKPHKNDSYLKTLHRKEIVMWACHTGYYPCVRKAISLFKIWMDGKKNPVPSSLRSAVYCTAIARGGPEEWQFLWTKYKAATAVSERNSALMALGCSEDTDILKQYLQWSIQKYSDIKPGDSVTVFKAVASTETGFSIAKEFFINNIGSIEENVGSFQVAEILELLASLMNQDYHLKEIEEFQSQNAQKLQQFTRTVSQVTEQVRYNIQWLQRNYQDIHTWLQQREPAALQVK